MILPRTASQSQRPGSHSHQNPSSHFACTGPPPPQGDRRPGKNLETCTPASVGGRQNIGGVVCGGRWQSRGVCAHLGRDRCCCVRVSPTGKRHGVRRSNGKQPAGPRGPEHMPLLDGSQVHRWDCGIPNSRGYHDGKLAGFVLFETRSHHVAIQAGLKVPAVHLLEPPKC